MNITRILKPGLFAYECFRILILALILILQGNEPGLSTRMIFAAPSALYPLMALFIWLDIDRYKVYLPLYIAGKCIGIFLFTLWSIVSQQVTIIGSRDAAAILAQLILSGDLFFIGAILIIVKSIKKPDKVEEM